MFLKNGFEPTKICRILWRFRICGPNEPKYSLNINFYRFFKKKWIFIKINFFRKMSKNWYLNYIWVHLDRGLEISIKFCIFWWVQIHFLRKFEKNLIFVWKISKNWYLNYIWVHLGCRFEFSMQNSIYWHVQIIFLWVFQNLASDVLIYRVL